MTTRTHDGDLQNRPADDAHDREPEGTRGPDNTLLMEDPLTGLPWTETLLPLVTSWARMTAVHAVCLHFVGLGILANLPEFQSSHSMLQEATDRIVPLMDDDDRLSRFSGNKLLLFSRRAEPAVRTLLAEISERLSGVGTEVDGRHIPEIRVGVARLGGGEPSAITAEKVNALISNAADATAPMAEIAAGRAVSGALNGPSPAASPVAEPGPGDADVAAGAPPPATARAAPLAPAIADAPALADTPTPAQVETEPAPAAPQVPMEQPAATAPATGRIQAAAVEAEEIMIIRGHPERTPIRPMAEPAPGTVPMSAPDPGHRLMLKTADVHVTGLVATAIVDLDFEGRHVRGKAIGRSAEGHHIPLVGEAMTRAITDLLPAGHGAVFRQAVTAQTDFGDAVVTVVEFLTPDSTDFLFGVAPVENGAFGGVARAIMNAVYPHAAHLLDAAA